MSNISNIFFFLSDTNIHTLCTEDEVHHLRIVTWFSNKRLNFKCWTFLSEKTLKSLIMNYDYTLFHCRPVEILLYVNVPVCLADVLLWVLSEMWPLSKSLRWFTRLRQIDWAFLTARPTLPHCQATLHVFFLNIEFIWCSATMCVCVSAILQCFDILIFTIFAISFVLR